MKKLRQYILALLMTGTSMVSSGAQYMRDITVAADGSGDFTTITQALEAIRAYMDYRVTVRIKNGLYQEKVIIPSWLENVDFIGEDVDKTIIRYNDYAGLDNMGTFRTYTVRVDGNHLTFKNITFDNTAGRVGQAVALHTEGSDLKFDNCRFLGNQDTMFLAGRNSQLSFDNCYVEGTTDFIFGPATAWFENCTIHCKADSYITAASTPENVEFGYVFKHCTVTAEPELKKVYLGRPWRPYAATSFIECELPRQTAPAGWENWRNPENEKTARYSEYRNHGEGAATGERVGWIRQLSDKEAAGITRQRVLTECK